eukprot:m.76900 g.76900  ORF g.76900 m.76900 type:complete len:616 (+) comp10564_c0_seq1:325-2172(+)
MSLDTLAVLQGSSFLREATLACIPSLLPSEIARVSLAVNLCDRGVQFAQVASARSSADQSSVVEAADLPRDAVCTRKATCTCVDCEAAMAAITQDHPSKTDFMLSSATDITTSLETFVAASIRSRVDALVDTDRAETVCGWLRDLVGATSATKEQMLRQERFVSALDEVALWQHDQARSRAGVSDPEAVCLQFSSDTVLAGLLRGDGLNALIALCAGPADCIRWRALALLLHLRCVDSNEFARTHNIPFLAPNKHESSPKIYHLSDKIYTQFYDVDAWLGPLAAVGITPRSTLIKLTVSDLEALVEGCAQAESLFRRADVDRIIGTDGPDGGAQAVFDCVSKTVSTKSANALQNMAEQITQAMKTFEEDSPGAVFVKLSTRSPKDSSLLQSRAVHLDEMDAECEGATMKVISGAEAIALLVTSDRAQQDLVAALSLAGRPSRAHDATANSEVFDGGISIVVREWWHLPRWTEMRGFVRKAMGSRRRLVALSQYYENTDVPKDRQRLLWENRASVCDTVQHFVRTTLNEALESISIDHAVVDFALKPRLSSSDMAGAVLGCDVVVIELNSFGIRSNAALFDWGDESDALILFEGSVEGQPVDFRLLPQDSGDILES